MSVKKIYIIMGSVRPVRLCPLIAEWAKEVLKGENGIDSPCQFEYQVIDLKDWKLPMDDEPEIPATGKYSQPHTIAWSNKIAQADGFVFIVPQYNWGYPAPLKNALDHLYAEWSKKPALLITYGGRGGGKAAEPIMEVFRGLHMQLLSSYVPVATKGSVYADTVRLFNEGLLDQYSKLLSDLGEELKTACS